MTKIMYRRKAIFPEGQESVMMEQKQQATGCWKQLLKVHVSNHQHSTEQKELTRSDFKLSNFLQKRSHLLKLPNKWKQKHLVHLIQH